MLNKKLLFVIIASRSVHIVIMKGIEKVLQKQKERNCVLEQGKGGGGALDSRRRKRRIGEHLKH